MKKYIHTFESFLNEQQSSLNENTHLIPFNKLRTGMKAYYNTEELGTVVDFGIGANELNKSIEKFNSHNITNITDWAMNPESQKWHKTFKWIMIDTGDDYEPWMYEPNEPDTANVKRMQKKVVLLIQC